LASNRVDGTFVDFDNNLNAAVTRLRQALGDSAEQSQFIETLPRLGYRFMAPIVIDPVSVVQDPSALATASPDSTPVDPPAAFRMESVAPAEARRGMRYRAIGAALLVVVIALAAVVWRSWPLAGSEPQGRRMLAVLPLATKTSSTSATASPKR
jgi:hypothetical protein